MLSHTRIYSITRNRFDVLRPKVIFYDGNIWSSFDFWLSLLRVAINRYIIINFFIFSYLMNLLLLVANALKPFLRAIVS